MYSPEQENISTTASTKVPVKYGELIVLGQSNADTQSVQSTISRFACRIMCQRTPPHTARIYAAGFDSSKNIFLGVSPHEPRLSVFEMR
ncbi:E3 ubiquitin-protein ligase pellino 1 [Liparis tanakae]|uniref:E3 ubiquitin-protein ligase pellino 1 n=1 Tax=Liparis tanakae TaxID=230148 RepID=A0A4Z2EE04_9TELE|nr:E3 ubiquitin-protein ligase pellino 1 [Liparis tanakae]